MRQALPRAFRGLSVLRAHLPGVALSAVIALAAASLASQYGAPSMLLALLIGMAFNFLAADRKCRQGVEFCARTVLRLGVCLMGLRLGFEELDALGPGPLFTVGGLVLVTLGFGAALSFLFGRRLAFGLLAGGSVAICGASAAMAISAVLPPRAGREKDTLFVVMMVTSLSTIAMMLYPPLFRQMGFDDTQAGFLIGATIHDVAQVVGAGYSLGEQAGLVATFVKMLRVALLPVVLLLIMAWLPGTRRQGVGLPWFVVGFIALAILANTGLLPEPVIEAGADASAWSLVLAIAALGVKTSLASMMSVGSSYAAILVLETLFLLAAALGFMFLWAG